ncbi:Tripartite motif-containing protein 3-like [Oopsacas minuta]|uniref:Tripartite motif-containing protein 3-like n=1 Tax=Oopsacas minuta TaxID=111878 RepID=A0AAV7JGL4_9METZ|nr:Tripartite motif-containing protein 3-like [Oopsacas minuta]
MATANTLERIFSVDYKSKIQPIVSVCKRGRGLENLGEPSGVTIDDSTGDIYVADYENNCVKVFDCNGQIMFKFRDEEGEGKTNGPIGYRTELMATANTLERIFSVDYKSKIQPIVSVYKMGEGLENLKGPRGVIIDNSTGDIYVADWGNNCVKVFDCNGQIMFKFGDEEGEGKMNGPIGIGKHGKGELEFYDPLGLTFDESNSEVYICDSNNNRI